VIKAARRFTEHKPHGSPLALRADHPAVVEARSYFSGNVVGSASQLRLLKSGVNSVKIGSHVTKGVLRGAPIFTLTLEERATCPRSCDHWHDCYGNKMHWPKRIRPDDGFLPRLAAELAALQEREGQFLVRLHVLGDFYSPEYVQFWRAQLEALPALYVYGYTARKGDAIAAEIDALNAHPRCSIRWSEGAPGWFRSITVETAQQPRDDAILCPAQTNRTECCGTCALCWATPKTIAFLRH
jgi:hypothetical protein